MPASRLRSVAAPALLAALVALAAIVPVSATAAASPPHAAFIVAVDGLEATFSDTSTGAPTSWAWDFGDGATSTLESPVHVFGAAGHYLVTLSATNDAGTDDASHHVTIKTPPPDQLYARNLYSPQVRYQNPDLTACVAASTMIMLNEIAANGARGTDFLWTTTTALATQRTILRWARAHDTLEPGPGGTDPNGWRNALNHYGWASGHDPSTMVYQVFAFGSYAEAVRAAVVAMARYRRPVGILAWAGGHAQVINGYSVFGQDPAHSAHFTVQSVYLTDPLKRDALRNRPISFARLATGLLKYRFRRYRHTDSPLDDPYTPGIAVADAGWFNRWVIVAPVK